MTGALAWPVVALIVLGILRRPLLRLVEILRTVKYGDLHFEFKKGMDQIAEDAALALDASEPPRTLDRADPLVQLASISPRAAVIDSWIRLEAAGVNCLRRRGVKVASHKLGEMAAGLVSGGFLTPAQGQLMLRLRDLRNVAAHAADFDLDQGDAVQFGMAAARLARAIEGIKMPGGTRKRRHRQS